MAGVIFWRIVGILTALVLTCWIIWMVFDRTTVDLKVHYGAAAPATQTTPTADPTAAPAAPATAKSAPAATPQASGESAVIVSSLQEIKGALDRIGAHETKQDERLDEFGRRLDALSPAAPSPTPADCPAGCVADVQHVTPRRN